MRKLIQKSGLFDAAWYAHTYPDVAASGLEPLEHFLRFGSALLRSPHPLFDARHYLRQLGPSGASGEHPLVHYLGEGWRQGFSPHPDFDSAYYLRVNPDVALSGKNPLLHYLQHGRVEGRHTQEKARSRDVLPLRHIAADNIVLLVLYASGHSLSALQMRQIEWWTASGLPVYLVVNARRFEGFEYPPHPALQGCVVRENKGFDFAAWKMLSIRLGNLSHHLSMTFANDSILPHRTAISSKVYIAQCVNAGWDVCYATKNLEMQEHFQSYFFTACTPRGISGVQDFIAQLPQFGKKDSLIRNGELAFSSELQKRGLNLGALHRILEAEEKALNPTIHYWEELIAQGFPFLKIQLITAGILDGKDARLKKYLNLEEQSDFRLHAAHRH